ncbi:putative membrane protein [Spathaspora sp. JA1]|nr:putative membrane protein [Spathaspora sp. JA1]
MTSPVNAWINFLMDEVGLVTISQAGADVGIIIALRMIRLIGFGATSLILALYMKSLDITEEYIGFFMTLTFIGDLVTSFLLSMVADQIGRKKMLIFCSLVMTLTGLVFSWVEDFYILTIVAVLGILTPSGVEVGPFRTIEQSSIASLVPHRHRSDIYAWYTFLGMFCGAFGSFLAGVIVHTVNDNYGYSLVFSYKCVFMAYTVLAAISFLLCIFLSSNLEPKPDVPMSEAESETTQLIANEPPKPKVFRLLPHLSPHTYMIVLKLSLLFGLDAFASSLTPTSWISYYLKNKFDISASYLGSVFFTTGIISAFTSLFSTSLTKRIGAVVTMVVTHLPASMLLTLVPFPSSFAMTMTILVIRASTQSMDVAPKHVFLATLVADADRTAVFGFVNVVKTLAQVIGPSIVGFLTKNGLQWITFVIAGSLKTTYDLGILATFLTYNHHSEH